MQIDWITVSAQVVNFLVLVALLRRFLYRPVLDAMEERQAMVQARLHEADERRQAADRDAERLAEERRLLDQRRDAAIAEAEAEAEQARRQRLEAARAEVAEQRAEWRQQLEQEKAQFLLDLRHRSVGAVRAVIARVLHDLADAELERQVVDAFIRRLDSLDEPTHDALVQTKEPIEVRTAFALDPALRRRLTRAMHQQLGPGVEVRYVRAPELACGIEVLGGGTQVGWNLEAFLAHLDPTGEAPGARS